MVAIETHEPLHRLDASTRLFAACLLVVVVHLVAAALLRSSTTNAIGSQPLWLGIFAAPPLLVTFARAGVGVRATLAAVIGVVATTLGASTSLPHAVLAGAAASDYTGMLATLAGLVMLGLAFKVGLSGRRLVTKLLAALLSCFVVIQWMVVPAINAGLASNARHPRIAAAHALGLVGARDVMFASGDGVRLSGWYVPGRNHAAVILLHGSHGTRADTIAHLRLLAASGYAVLAYDARGHGKSGGRANALGWHGVQDIAGAVRYLRRQPGIDARRIAAVGLSMGAEESLRAAGSGVPLAAIVADGAGATTLSDNKILPVDPLFVSVTWVAMRADELATGDAEPAPLRNVVERVHVPALLIASNARDERAIDAAYRDRIGSNATLWYVHDAGHTQALSVHPREYAARVSAFLETALGEVRTRQPRV